MTQSLSPAQQAQIDNRDATGQFKAKAHGDVEDTAGVLGVGPRPDAPAARDPRDIDPLTESGVELTGEEHRAISQDNHQRWDYHRSQAETMEEELASFPGEADPSEIEAVRFHRAAQWAYEAEHHASFAAFEEGEHGRHDLVQYNRHGQVLRDLDGSPQKIGTYERASPRSIPEELRTDEGHFDLKKARAASDDHLETTPREEMSPWKLRAGHRPTPSPRDEATKVAYAKSAHRASSAASRFGGHGTGRDVAADEAEAVEQATRHVPTTSLREDVHQESGVVDHERPGEVRQRDFDVGEARVEADWQREL